MKEKNQRRPIIGISSNLAVIETGPCVGRERVILTFDYVQAIALAGGIPVILPVVDAEEQVMTQAELIDGLLLSGGQDVAPSLYGEQPEQALGSVHHERDRHEILLIQHTHRKNKPIFGICRGIQVLNIAFGGTLYQDIGGHSQTVLQHSQKSKPESPAHTVHLVEGSLLHRLIGAPSVEANSFHHQAVKTVAPGFVVTAKTEDQLVEAIEREGDQFTLGVQWHPELMHRHHSAMQRLFNGFVEAAKNY